MPMPMDTKLNYDHMAARRQSLRSVRGELCEARYVTGPNRGRKCVRLAAFHIEPPGPDIYVCHAHSRAYTKDVRRPLW